VHRSLEVEEYLVKAKSPSSRPSSRSGPPTRPVSRGRPSVAGAIVYIYRNLGMFRSLSIYIASAPDLYRGPREGRRLPASAGRRGAESTGGVLGFRQGRAGQRAGSKQGPVQQNVINPAAVVAVAAVVALVPAGEARLGVRAQRREGVDHAVLVEDRAQPSHLRGGRGPVIVRAFYSHLGLRVKA